MARRSRGSTSTKRRTTTKRKSTPASPFVLLLAAGLLLLVYLYENGSLDEWLGTETTTPTPVVTTGDVQPFFTTTSLVYPDQRDQRGDSPLLSAVLADIEAAQATVALATFDLDVPQVTDALIAAKQRGLDVRVIVDSENLETPEVAQETGRLSDAEIPVRFDDREPFMHNKFLVLDDGIAWTGSWNLTENDTFRNNNNMVRIVSSEVALNYKNEFEQMFGGTFGGRKTSATPYPNVQIGDVGIETYFSPEDGVAKYVLERIENAQQSIRFLTFSFTSDDIARAMIAKRNAGISVDGVFETQNAGGTGAEFQVLQDGGVNVLEDGNCYILHHKTIIIDERIVITGSYNFTASAERDNDENLVIIDNPAIAQQYTDEFNRLYTLAQNPLRCGR